MMDSQKKSKKQSNGKVLRGFLEGCPICRRRVDVRLMRDVQGVWMCMACVYAVGEESRRLSGVPDSLSVPLPVTRFKKSFRFR